MMKFTARCYELTLDHSSNAEMKGTWLRIGTQPKYKHPDVLNEAAIELNATEIELLIAMLTARLKQLDDEE